MSGFINIVALFLTRHAFFTCFLGHKVLLLSPFRGASDLHTFTGAIQGMYVFCMSICRCTYPDCVKNPIRQAIGITPLSQREIREYDCLILKRPNTQMKHGYLLFFFHFFFKSGKNSSGTQGQIAFRFLNEARKQFLYTLRRRNIRLLRGVCGLWSGVRSCSHWRRLLTGAKTHLGRKLRQLIAVRKGFQQCIFTFKCRVFLY